MEKDQLNNLNVDNETDLQLMEGIKAYTLELWHSMYGLMRTQEIQNTNEPIETFGLPQGWYIIITKENGQPIKQTKIMIQ